MEERFGETDQEKGVTFIVDLEVDFQPRNEQPVSGKFRIEVQWI